MAQQNFWATNEIYRIHVWVLGDWGVFVCLVSNCLKKKKVEIAIPLQGFNLRKNAIYL